MGLFDVDEFFQTLSPATPTIASFLAVLDPAVAVINVENVWFGGCPDGNRYVGLVTQLCLKRSEKSMPLRVGRSKYFVRPSNATFVVVHNTLEPHGPALNADAYTELRMNHYKPERPKGVNDTSMTAIGPALRAEIFRAYPNGIPEP